MKTLSEIESAAKDLRLTRDKLAVTVDALNQTIERAKREALPAIKRYVARCAECHAELKAAIEESPSLFIRPRTHTVHGIKFGLEKGKGKIHIPDPDKTVERIEALFREDTAATLIHIKKSPNKDAIAQLQVADLKRIGCTVEDAGDRILIKFTDSAVDKLVNALLKDATEEAPESQAA